MSEFQDGWAKNKETKIHYLGKGKPSPGRITLVVSPGLWEPAERAIPLFNRLDRNCIALSYRGRGKSDTPKTGYDLQDHVDDLSAVISAEKLERICLLGFSRGVPYAVAYTLQNIDTVAGLILVDQPPAQYRWAEGTAAYWKSMKYLGKPIVRYIRPEALDRIEKEARGIQFWNDIHRIKCPVLIMRGLNTSHSRPPNLSEQDSMIYRKLLVDMREAGFEKSGHMIPDDEPEKYAESVNDFLLQLDEK